LLENRILSRVPFGQHSLLFKLGELPPVVDACENLPHENESETNGHNGPNDTKDDAHDVHHNWTLLGLLDPDLKLTSLILVAIDKGEPAVIVINKCTQSLIILNKIFCLLNHLRNKRTLGTLVNTPFIHLSVKFPGEEDLTLDTRLEFLTLARTCWTIFTVFTRILSLLRLLTLTFSTLTSSMTRAEFVDVFSVWRDAGLRAGPTLAGRVALHVPLGVTLTLATDALPVVRTGAELAIVTITAEVVTLAIVTGHDLVSVVTRITLALATDAVSAIVTQGRGCVVWSTSGLQVSAEGQILCRTFTFPTKEVWRTFADTTLVGSNSITQRTSLFVSRVSRPLASTLTHHLQVHHHTLIDTNGIDLEGLSPFSWILGTLDDLNLGGEGDLGAHLES